MTICFKGHIVSFSPKPRDASQALAHALVQALYQSYPERF